MSAKPTITGLLKARLRKTLAEDGVKDPEAVADRLLDLASAEGRRIREAVERRNAEILRSLPMADVAGPVAGPVIALPGTDGVRHPAFQFGTDGDLLGEVALINGLLEAESDPWGAILWWLEPDPRLDGRRPIDTPTDERLVGMVQGELAALAAELAAEEAALAADD